MSKKSITLGILAHVDAGKTTLSEALLFECGAIRQLGRVDHKDTFLDTDEQEKERGITIFSKQAELEMGETHVMLLDTPGHVDFSAEMERTLGVLDYAVLVISGKEGVQGHTVTLWKLLERYDVPTFIWVNKMDMEGAYEEEILGDMRENLSAECIKPDDYEQLAMVSEEMLEEYLENGTISDALIAEATSARKVFPCYFGSALKQTGVTELIDGIDRLTLEPEDGSEAGEFGARVFKITRDERGERLTHLKICGGRISVRESIETGTSGDEPLVEKVNQIRIYSGDKYRTVETAEAGTVCQITGLQATYAGQGLGVCEDIEEAVLEPVLSYGVIVPDEVNVHDFLAKLRVIEEEDPKLHVEWNEQLHEIQLKLMGEIQLEVIKKVILERTGVAVEFTEGSIAYRETIGEPADGYGHFEPLRHYAEVRVRLEPLPRGSGVRLATIANEDNLDRNWQRLILTHFGEKDHLGALTGSPITDVRIVLVDGRAHLKHTEGGDFRQATYRAIRNALRTAEAAGNAVLLEPWYEYTLSVPAEMVGRAMTDIQNMGGNFEAPLTTPAGITRLTGRAPVDGMRSYASEVASYTKGYGQLSLRPAGYDECHDAASVIKSIGYDADRDVENTADSVFCSHGAGVNIPWYEVKEHAHVSTEDYWKEPEPEDLSEWDENGRYRGSAAARNAGSGASTRGGAGGSDASKEATDADLKRIFERTYGPERKKEMRSAKVLPTAKTFKPTKPLELLPEFLLVDGYNIIFAWEELKELARINIDSAREALIEILENYRGTTDAEIIVVFDAYRVQGGERRSEKHGNIWVVYTAEAESADSYIEKTTFETKNKRYRVRVATSDVAEQIITRNNNAIIVTPKALRAEVDQAEAATREWLEEYRRKLEMREKAEGMKLF